MGTKKHFPTFNNAIIRSIENTLEKSKDGLIRVNFNPLVDIKSVISILAQKNNLRIGILQPFSHIETNYKSVSQDPREITKWRNESIIDRKKNPIIIFGNAKGREESGLKRIHSIITEKDILQIYQEEGKKWLRDNVSDKTTAPDRFFHALIQMSFKNLIDTNSLSEMCFKSFNDSKYAHLKPQKELWKIGLIPDSRAQDSKTPLDRLLVNYSYAEFLRSVADSNADQKKWQRLKEHAEQGNETAKLAIQYSNTKKEKYLSSLQLDDLLEVMEAKSSLKKKGEGGEPYREINLFEFLDIGSKKTKKILNELNKLIDLDQDEVDERIEIDTNTTLHFYMKAKSKSDEVIDVEGDSQTLTQINIIRDDIVQQTMTHTSVDILNQLKMTIQLISTKGKTLSKLITDLLNIRLKLVKLFRWEEYLLELLLIDSTLIKLSTEYLNIWQEIVHELLNQDIIPHTKTLREYFILVDAVWNVEETNSGKRYTECQLFPVHPFVLAPIVALLQYVREKLGEPDIGTQILWAKDRSLPAYPAIWSPDFNPLIFSEGSTAPTFQIKPPSSRPSASSGHAIVDIVKSYIGLHPFATNSLSLLLIDPPKGNGVPSAIRAISKIVNHQNVYIGFTEPRKSEIAITNPEIRNIGHVNLSTLWSDLKFRVHITFCFRGARVLGTHSGLLQPTHGIHNVLTVSATQPSVIDNSEYRGKWIPFVCMQPGDANDIVQTFLKLTHSFTKEVEYYEVRPMLKKSEEEEIASIGEFCDWLVIGTPSPIGLIPPRKFPDEALTFLGREDFGAYSLFVYSHDLFSIRRRFQQELSQAPLLVDKNELEEQLQILAITVPNGVLRIGRGEQKVTPHIGVIAASYFARGHHGNK